LHDIANLLQTSFSAIFGDHKERTHYQAPEMAINQQINRLHRRSVPEEEKRIKTGGTIVPISEVDFMSRLGL
jgi:hypothetical protein